MDVSGHRGLCADAEHVAASKQRYLCALLVDRQQPIMGNNHPPMPAISTIYPFVTMASPSIFMGESTPVQYMMLACSPVIIYFWKRLAQLS